MNLTPTSSTKAQELGTLRHAQLEEQFTMTPRQAGHKHNRAKNKAARGGTLWRRKLPEYREAVSIQFWPWPARWYRRWEW